MSIDLVDAGWTDPGEFWADNNNVVIHTHITQEQLLTGERIEGFNLNGILNFANSAFAFISTFSGFGNTAGVDLHSDSLASKEIVQLSLTETSTTEATSTTEGSAQGEIVSQDSTDTLSAMETTSTAENSVSTDTVSQDSTNTLATSGEKADTIFKCSVGTNPSTPDINANMFMRLWTYIRGFFY